jgi:hypothetical protein
MLSVAGVFLFPFAAPVSAQALQREIAPERGFSIPAGAQVPVVLRTQPDAVCDLHPQADASNPMKVYANTDGYVQFHVNTELGSQKDLRLQLDCAAAGSLTTHPVHLRVGPSPTADMPAPQTSVPVPQGARVRPALTDQAARLLTDHDLLSRGYPPRPDPTQSPDAYAKWLKNASRPITLLPSHGVSSADPPHALQAPAGGTNTSKNWSGLEARGYPGYFTEVTGEWNVPAVVNCGNPYKQTYSYLWVGMDGDPSDGGSSDLVQAGTMQNCHQDASGASYAAYHAWTQWIQNGATQGPAVINSLPINAGDDVLVHVWIGDRNGAQDWTGGYAWYFIQNNTHCTAIEIFTPLGGPYFKGMEAEWIMEAPGALSDYGAVFIRNAKARTPYGWQDSSTLGGTDITLIDKSGNVLSFAFDIYPDMINFLWFNYL